jgi:hypothetical protein
MKTVPAAAAERPLSVRQATFGGTCGNDGVAPIADLPALTGWFDPMRSFTQRADFGPS